MIKLKWADRYLNYNSIEWSGTAEQASRELAFSVPSNPYDSNFENAAIKLGDVVKMYDGKTLLFLGIVTSRERTAEIGTASYCAKDFLHYLLRSKASYKFKNKSPEAIVKKLCSDLKIKTSGLAKTGVNISKLIFQEQSYYDMAIRAYREAKHITGKKYMLAMSGAKVSVIQKGKSSGVTLEQGVNITDATYSDNTDNMINQVRIYDSKNKKIGQVSNSNTSLYGIYQESYKKESGKNAKKVAKSLFVGITKEATVESVGNVKCLSGYSLIVKDKATGLSGTFYITADTHTFENGVHTMSLELSYYNTQESGADIESKGKVTKNTVKNSSRCYYFDGSYVYHSSKECPACKGHKNINTSTVLKMKKIKIKSGVNKGKRKYKPCSKCWEV